MRSALVAVLSVATTGSAMGRCATGGSCGCCRCGEQYAAGTSDILMKTLNSWATAGSVKARTDTDASKVRFMGSLLTNGPRSPRLRQWSSRKRRSPPLAVRNGRGGALAEEFGSVTRRFPRAIIALEALSPMVFIHTRRIIIVPSNQHLLGFLAPPFESHCRFGSHIY